MEVVIVGCLPSFLGSQEKSLFRTYLPPLLTSTRENVWEKQSLAKSPETLSIHESSSQTRTSGISGIYISCDSWGNYLPWVGVGFFVENL